MEHVPTGSQELSERQQSIHREANTSKVGWVSRSEGGETLRSTRQRIRQGVQKL